MLPTHCTWRDNKTCLLQEIAVELHTTESDVRTKIHSMQSYYAETFTTNYATTLSAKPFGIYDSFDLDRRKLSNMQHVIVTLVARFGFSCILEKNIGNR